MANINTALDDFVAAYRRRGLAGMLGWQDVKQRYRRSKIGPFWLTISMGVTVATIGIVFGSIFGSPMREYLPFLACGLILWGFISSTLTDGCHGFIGADAVIKQLPIPLATHVLRVMWRNIIMLAHNIVILPIVFLVFLKPASWTIFLVVPGLLLLFANLAWVCLILATVCARYRDIPQIISSVLQVCFYVTPIMWMPSQMKHPTAAAFMELNPIFHLLEIVRAPILGTLPTLTNWGVALGLASVGWIATLAFFGRYKNRVAYWL
jgi:ABC-type polysaccharide/polyol phosphate export permease